MNSFKDLNLNDSQKYQILNIADKNKDGKINASEFLSFIKSIKNIDNNDNSEVNKNKKNELPQINSMSNSSSMAKISKRSNGTNDNIQSNGKISKRKYNKS